MKTQRGAGHGVEYKPWILTGEFPSASNFIRVKGRTVSRVHHLLSTLEYKYFMLLDFSDKVIDIREQYPLLPREETCEIANSLNVRHPPITKKKYSGILTTDFLLTYQDGKQTRYLARTVKPKKELTKRRVLEKFEIERIYWKNKNIDWGIVTEDQIDEQKYKNFKLINHAFDPAYNPYTSRVLASFLSFSAKKHITLSDFFEQAQPAIGTYAEANKAFMALLYSKTIRWDYTIPFSKDLPLHFFSYHEK